MTEHRVRVKWKGGYVEVSDGGTGRVRTHAFDASAVKTRAQAVEVGENQLLIYGYGPQRSHNIDLAATADIPGVGDLVATIGGEGTPVEDRITALRWKFGPDGRVRLSPTVGTKTDELVTRQTRVVKRLANPDAGRSGASQPFQQEDSNVQTGTLPEPGLTEWSWDPCDTTDGEIVKVSEPLIVTQFITTFTIPLPDDVQFRVAWSDAGGDPEARPVTDRSGEGAYWIVPAGRTQWANLGRIFLLPDQVIQVNCWDVGTNTAADLDFCKVTVQARTATGSLTRDTSRPT